MGVEYEVTDIRRDKVGAQAREVLTARRTSTPKPPRLPLASLDVHAPAGGQEVILCFTCHAPEFARWDQEFHRWLQTLSTQRPRQAEVSDRSDPILAELVAPCCCYTSTRIWLSAGTGWIHWAA